MTANQESPGYDQGMWGQLVRFAVSGALGFGVDTGVLYGFMAVGVPFQVARAFSFLAAATFTWGFNRRHTFRSSALNPPSWREWLHYLAAMAVGGVINYGVSVWCYQSGGLFRDHPVLALALGTGAGMVVNFLSARFLVFRLSKPAD